MGRRKKYTDSYIRREAVHLLRYARSAPIPFLKDFCTQRRYSSQKMSEFEKKSDIFREALKRVKDIQEIKIVKAALVNKINVTMAIFALKNVAGWRDKLIEVNQTVKNEKYITVYLPGKEDKRKSVGAVPAARTIPQE